MSMSVEEKQFVTTLPVSCGDSSVSEADLRIQELALSDIDGVGAQRSAFEQREVSIAKPVCQISSLNFEIPVVDMKDYFDLKTKGNFLKTLYKAMTDVGFFAVRNTGVNVNVVREAYAQAEKFFKSDSESKQKAWAPALNGQRGFVPGETAKGNLRKDQKEFYHIGRNGSLPENVWPDQPEFKTALSTLYSELEKYIVPLQEAIIDTINAQGQKPLPKDLLNSATKTGDTLLRALYYPALPKEEITPSDQPTYWAAPHTDIDFLAILPYATEKGLQVKLNDQWMNVVVPEDSFIVNVGDMLQNLTNGLFKSAWHRVVAQEPGKERFSMVLFVHPAGDASLEPLPECIALTGGAQKYGPGTRDQFLWERLLELGIAPALLELYSKTGHVESQAKYGRESSQVVQMLIEKNLASPELLKTLEEKK